MFQLIGPGLKREHEGPCWCKLVASLKRIFVSKREDIIYCMQNANTAEVLKRRKKYPAALEMAKINNLQKL